jgi:hypothetical protein
MPFVAERACGSVFGMEIATNISRIAARPRTLRSKVTNGVRVFAIGGDGRGAWTRRWRDLVELHSADCGGAEHMSEGDIAVDLDLYNRLAGNHRRILESIGIERRPRDVTPTLQTYLAAKDAAE